MSHRRIQPASLAHRAYVALCIGLLLAMGVFGANARLHAALHDSGQPAESHHQGEGDSCAVALFATGVSVPLDVPAGMGMPVRLEPARLTATADIWLAKPEHRLMPGRGPPQG